MCVCTLYLTVVEEHKLRVFENRALKKYFGVRVKKYGWIDEKYLPSELIFFTKYVG